MRTTQNRTQENTTVGGNNAMPSHTITSNKHKHRDPKMNSLSGNYNINVLQNDDLFRTDGKRWIS